MLDEYISWGIIYYDDNDYINHSDDENKNNSDKW